MPTGSLSARTVILARQTAILLLAVTTSGSAAAQGVQHDAQTVAPGPSTAPGAPPFESATPANLVMPDTLRQLVTRMWRESPAFRRQCTRLMETTVIVHIELAARTSHGRALSLIRRDGAGLHAAVEIELR